MRHLTLSDLGGGIVYQLQLSTNIEWASYDDEELSMVKVVQEKTV